MRIVAALLAGFAALAIPRASAQPALEQRKPIAVVLRISTPSLFAPDGRPTPDRDSRLERIADALDALNASDIAAVPIALAPSAVMCDEAMRLRSGPARHFVRAIRAVASHSAVLQTPFANVRLTDVEKDGAGGELRAGRSTLDRCTRTTAAPVLYPPAFALDPDALVAAEREGIGSVLSDAVDVPTRSVIDVLPARNVPRGDTPASLIARTPESAPSIAVADIGSMDGAAYVRALHREARLVIQPVTSISPEKGAEAEEIDFRSVSDSTAAYRRALVRADRAFERFSAFTLPDNPVTGVYRDLVARARGSADQDETFTDGRRRANRFVQLVSSAERGVSIGAGSITFTSRRGSVPITVINRDRFPVRLSVAVSSPKLDFPGGAARVVTVEPPGDTITFGAVARSTGTFPMRATVSAPGSSVELDTAEVTVRSTGANLPALALTIGGAVVLIVFYARRRKRQHP